jgi:hypothetical protein
MKSDKISGTKKGVKCEVIEWQTTGDWLWESLYEQLGQMDKYSSRTHRTARPPAFVSPFYFILHLLYDVMDIPFGEAGFCDGE